MPAASSGSSMMRAIALAIASTSSAGTSRPVSSSVMLSRCPSAAVATTGRSDSWASTTALPKGSRNDGATTRSALARCGQIGLQYPAKCTAPARSGCAARCSNSATYHS